MSNNQQYGLNDLLYLMSRLRDPKTGCPWDISQDYRSIAPSTIEEAYEVVDAIESEDFIQLKEELGDFLFQVIFYSQLATEEQRFDFHDIVSGLTEKLIRRHPHVFPDADLHQTFSGERTASDEAAIKRQWEIIKSSERTDKGLKNVLDDVPVSLPALSRAAKLQKRASGVGFDWPEITPVFDKLIEEVEELKEALRLNDSESIKEEVGDLLFSAVNLSRHLSVEPESSLRAANNKFESRFGYVEKRLREQGISFEDASLEQMDSLWDEAKRHLIKPN